MSAAATTQTTAITPESSTVQRKGAFRRPFCFQVGAQGAKSAAPRQRGEIFERLIRHSAPLRRNLDGAEWSGLFLATKKGLWI